jgi:hypothetical protein
VKTYSKIVRAGGCVAAVSSHYRPKLELTYQTVKALREFAREAGVPWNAESATEYFKRARITELAQTGDDLRRLIELDL